MTQKRPGLCRETAQHLSQRELTTHLDMALCGMQSTPTDPIYWLAPTQPAHLCSPAGPSSSNKPLGKPRAVWAGCKRENSRLRPQKSHKRQRLWWLMEVPSQREGVAELPGSCNTNDGERQENFPFSKFSCQQSGNKTNLDPSLFFPVFIWKTSLVINSRQAEYNSRVLRQTSCQNSIGPVPWGPAD